MMKNMTLLKLHGIRLLMFLGTTTITFAICILVASYSMLQVELSPLLFIWIPFLVDILTVIKLRGNLFHKIYNSEKEKLQKLISLIWYYGDYVVILAVIFFGIKELL